MRFMIYNGAMQTTSSPAKVATGTSLKTMLQIAPLVPMRVVGWGFSGDASAAATPGTVDFIEGDVAATVTANVAADITAWDPEALVFLSNGGAMSTFFTLSTSGTGFTATVEGSITTTRNLDGPQLIAPTTQFLEGFTLGDRPVIQKGKFARIRANFAASVNIFCYVVLTVGE